LGIDVKKLSEFLHTLVVAITAAQKIGLDELADKVLGVVGTEAQIPFELSAFNEETENSKIFARYNFISTAFQESVKY
jgi:Fe2+ transport system protein B